MQIADMPLVAKVISVAHPKYYEDTAVFAERMMLYPNGCCCVEQGGKMIGYGVAHPSRLGRPPLLNTCLGALPQDADCLHLHDVALLPEGRGTGLPLLFLEMLRKQAVSLRLRHLSLIAVAGREAYWTRQGFSIFLGDAELQRRLASYGDDSVYMTAALP